MRKFGNSLEMYFMEGVGSAISLVKSFIIGFLTLLFVIVCILIFCIVFLIVAYYVVIAMLIELVKWLFRTVWRGLTSFI